MISLIDSFVFSCLASGAVGFAAGAPPTAGTILPVDVSIISIEVGSNTTKFFASPYPPFELYEIPSYPERLSISIVRSLPSASCRSKIAANVGTFSHSTPLPVVSLSEMKSPRIPKCSGASFLPKSKLLT